MRLNQAMDVYLKHLDQGLKVLRADSDLTDSRKEFLERLANAKIHHGERTARIANQLIGQDTSRTFPMTPRLQEAILCACLLHDIGDLHRNSKVLPTIHAQLGYEKLINEEGLNPGNPYDFIVLKMIEQHSGFKPELTGNTVVDYAIKLLRDSDFLADATYLIEDIHAPSRSTYFAQDRLPGPLTPINIEAFHRGDFIRHQDMKTLGDCILMQGAKQATLSLDVSKKFWKDGDFKNRFWHAARETERKAQRAALGMKPR